MFPFPVTAHWPNAAWEREKALPDKTLAGSKCFIIFIIILKNSNSTHRIFCLVKRCEAGQLLSFTFLLIILFILLNRQQNLGRPT